MQKDAQTRLKSLVSFVGKTGFKTGVVETLSAFLLGGAFAVIQILIGGTRLIFSLPAYGLLAAVALLASFSARRSKSEPDLLCLWSAIAFLGYVLIRALLSPVPYLARPDIYSVLAGLVVYFFVSCVLTDAKQRMFLLLFLLVAGMVHTVIGAIQFRDGNNFMPIPFLQRFDYGRRASGFYVCPNHLAGLLEVVGIFGLSLTCWSRWPIWAKLLVGYAAVVCYAGLVLTGSRGGYLSAAASLFIFALLSLIILRKRGFEPFWKIGGGGLLAAGVVLLVAVFFVQKSDFLSGRAQNLFDMANMRLDFWHAAVQQWKLQPLFGTGSGTYLFYGREFRTITMQLDPIEVHNDYLHLLCEYGVIGSGVFLIFLGSHLRWGLKTFLGLGPQGVSVSAHLASNALALNLGALSAIAAYLVHSFLDFNLHIPANVLLLAFVFGLIANPGIELPSGSQRVESVMPGWRLTLAALGLILVVQCVRLLPAEYFTERARVALRDFRPTDAISFALRALDDEKQNPFLYDYLGRARASQGYLMTDGRARASFYRAAADAFSKARELSPRDKVFAIDLALTYDILGRFPEAEWMYYEALALDPKSSNTQGYYRPHLQKWQSLGQTQGATAKENARP